MKNRSMTLSIIAGIILISVAACASPADPLNGTAWNLVSYDDAALVPGTTITVKFEDGKVGGSSGCNSYGGTYQLEDEKLHITDVISTLMACLEPEGAMDQESLFLNGLNNTQTFRLSGGQLEIVTSDGKTLTFSPQ